MTQPKIWVRVVEAHAARTWVAIILAVSAGISLIMLVAAGMWNTVSNPHVTDLSPNYSSAISSTLGLLVGSLATYIGMSAESKRKDGDDEVIRDDHVTLNVEHPEKKADGD